MPLAEKNPYESPKCLAGPLASPADHDDARLLLTAWATVFVVNMAMPVFFAWSITGESGRIGMIAASVVLFGCGCWICLMARRLAKGLIVGAVLVALTQVFPALQILAGILGLAVAEALHLSQYRDRGPEITTELGGFVVTLITGGILMGLSGVTGTLVQRLLPSRWKQNWLLA